MWENPDHYEWCHPEQGRLFQVVKESKLNKPWKASQ